MKKEPPKPLSRAWPQVSALAALLLTTTVFRGLTHRRRLAAIEIDQVNVLWCLRLVGPHGWHKFDLPELEGAVRVQGLQGVHAAQGMVARQNGPVGTICATS